MKKFIYLATAASALIAAGQASAATNFAASGNGFVIPFGLSTQTSTATVATSGAITSLTFSLDLLAHTSARDLTATVSHGGITATLFSGLSCCRGLLGDYDFTTTAAAPLKDAGGFLVYAPGTYSFSYPVAGTSFLGADAAGNWSLAITDNRRLGVGLLGGWSVSGVVASVAPAAAVPEPATWAMMIAGFGAIGAAMRRRTRVRVGYAAA